MDPRDKELTKLKYQNYLNRIIPMLNEIIEERAHLSKIPSEMFQYIRKSTSGFHGTTF